MMCGGASDVKEATADIQKIAEEVRSPLEEKVGKKFDEYKATHYRSQVVAGTNFFIKIHVGNEEYVHARVFRPLPGQGDLSLHSHQHGKNKDEEIAYF